MTQLVARIDDELLAGIDSMIGDGEVSSRSEAVRKGLRVLLDMHRRKRIADAIVEGYRRQPQTEDEIGWSDDMTVAMINEEPW